MATKISHVGEVFSYYMAGINFIYIPQTIEPEGEVFTEQSYVGRKIMIYPDGTSSNVYWCVSKAAFDCFVKGGKYIKIR